MRYLIIIFLTFITLSPSIGAQEETDFTIKQISDTEFILNRNGNCSDRNFKDSSFDAACLIDTKKNVQTKSCTINFTNKDHKRFLSHKLKLLDQSKVIEFTVKDSRRLSAYRNKIKNKDNWISSYLLRPYLIFLKNQNIKEHEYIVIDENGLSDVKILSN